MPTSALADAGRLIALAAKPKETPIRNVAYRQLVEKYLDDVTFAADCDSIADGMGITLHVDRIAGVIAVAEHDSPLRMPIAAFMRQTLAPYEKALAGVIVLAIARCAYPSPEHVDDPNRATRITVAAVVGYLNRTCERLAADAGDPYAGGIDANALWRAWDQLREARHSGKRISKKEKYGFVTKMCAFLVDEGHLQELSNDDGGTYRPTHRFRIAVRTLVEDSDAFTTFLTASTATDTPEPHTDGDTDTAAGADSDEDDR